MEVTFIEEDGSGKPDATSYVSLDFFKQYWFNADYNYGTLSDNGVYRLLNRASAYIDNNYRKGFPGYRQYEDQALEWPRTGAYYLDKYDIDESLVPVEIKNATCEAAYLLFTGIDLSETISKGGKLNKSKVKVDVIEEELGYEDGSGFYTDIYTIIDNTLSRITGGVSDRFVLKVIRVGGESP